MNEQRLLELICQWATDLNDNNHAGAIVEVTNDFLVLMIKNKRFTPFFCKIKIMNQTSVTIEVTTHFNYGKNIRDIIYDRLQDDRFQNYIFSKINFHGNLSNDFELISQNISHAANKFFDQSDFSYNEITAFKTPII